MYQMKKGGSSKSRKQQAAIAISMKAAGKKPKMAKGGSFPDLTGDGKVTKADVLKGRGVFKKGGSVGTSKMKKYKEGGTAQGKPVIKGIKEYALGIMNKKTPFVPTRKSVGGKKKVKEGFPNPISPTPPKKNKRMDIYKLQMSRK